MRLRPFAALSVAAVSAVLLAGCSGLGGPADPSPTSSGAADLCDAAVAPGDASNAVKVNGDVGTASTVTFTAPLDVSEVHATGVAEGTAARAKSGDLVSYALSAFDAATGTQLPDTPIGYEPGELLPAPISPDSPLASILGCGAPGERVVAAFPASGQTGAQVYIVDLLDIVPNKAWGEKQDAVEGMPTVKLAKNGAPTITIPKGDAPAETTLATLRQGDGATVQSGDQVRVQYTGVRWSDGKEFDSTWSKGGVPTAFATTGVVEGFKRALEGAQIGSQVLVVIPPKDGYGEGEINEKDLKGDTLVFVVDILGAQHPQAQ